MSHALRATRSFPCAETMVAEQCSDTYYRLRYATMQYEYVSPAIEQLLGYTPHEFCALQVRKLILETRMVPQAMQRVMEFAPLEDARQRGEVLTWNADYRMHAKDGRSIWVSDISYPWVDESGTVIGSVGCLRDITERVHAEQHWLNERLRSAQLDELSGLHHRQYFFERLENEAKRVLRSRADLSIAVIDIDQFRSINHEHGAIAGDNVIREIANRINDCLRETDMAARTGGGEFAVLMPDTMLEGAAVVAERIRAAVAQKPILAGDSAVVPATVSIGVAEVDSEETANATVLYRNANTRLFIAKHSGRNQVSADTVQCVH